jgi:FMN reductase [NAD(P)H]
MTEPYSDELQARFGFDLDLGGDAPNNAWIKQVLMRRTQRRYDARPIPESVLRLVLAAAFSTSSKSDFQQASVIRVEDRAQRDKLAALLPNMPWIGNAPVFLVFLGDARRLERIAKHPVENGTLEGFFNATVDAALAMQTCILAAETLGLGTCPISHLRNHIDAVGEILALPCIATATTTTQ